MVLKEGLLWYSFSLYVCIFCAILNNSSRFVFSLAEAQMAMAHPTASSFNLYKNRPALKLIVKLFSRINVDFLKS